MSALTFAKTFTGLAARGLSSLLAGVLPKKMHSALPGGQYAIAPISTSALECSSSTLTGIEKYISSPHRFALPSIGNASQIRSAVCGFSLLNAASTVPVAFVDILIRLSKIIKPALGILQINQTARYHFETCATRSRRSCLCDKHSRG